MKPRHKRLALVIIGIAGLVVATIRERLEDQGFFNVDVFLRPGEISMGKPFSLATYATTAQFKNVRLRRLDTGAYLRKWR